MGAPPTAAIIIIGNEILSGKVHDSNSYFLAAELRNIGVDVRAISVLPDEIDIIGKQVSEAAASHDYVFTSGGVGPTHDDITMEGVAKGFGVKTVRNKTLEGIILRRCGDRTPDESALKMAELPEGAELILNEGMRFPVVVFRNVYIFPGIPRFLREKFSAVKDRFRSRPFHVKKVYVNEDECFIAYHLGKVVEDYPEVSIGSYPQVDKPDYKITVTLESTDEGELEKAYYLLLELLPPEIIVRTE
ncbi:MAG: competence/damage-inducible protein A [Thermodesulfovibrionales bacterium]|nr:competence/damage-inducible protein A [Thermodesulfovibrionales bacterium]